MKEFIDISNKQSKTVMMTKRGSFISIVRFHIHAFSMSMERIWENEGKWEGFSNSYSYLFFGIKITKWARAFGMGE